MTPQNYQQFSEPITLIADCFLSHLESGLYLKGEGGVF